MASTKFEKFDKANPGVVERVVQQKLCIAVLDILFDDVDDKPNTIELLKAKRLPEAKNFEKEILKNLKSYPAQHQSTLRNITHEVQRALTIINKDEAVCPTKVSAQQVYRRVLPRFYAYAQMDPANKLTYVTRILQELAKKPTVVTRDLNDDQYRAYIWLHPDEFESIKDEYDCYIIQFKAKSDDDAIKQKIQGAIRRKEHLLDAVCSLIDPDSDHTDLAEYFHDNVMKASVELRKALGFPVTDPTFRLFKEYFTEDKAAANLTHKDNVIKDLSTLVLEHGTEKITNLLKEYFKDLEEESD